MRRTSILLSILFLSALAQAPASASVGNNCAFFLQPLSQDADGTTLATPVLIGCYPTHAEALAAGSDGGIDVSASVTLRELTAAAAQVSGSGAVLIGTEWGGSNFSGASNDYFATSTCSATDSWEVGYVGDTWNDRFNSGKGFGGCDTNKKFEGSNFNGTVVVCTPNCSDYGASDNHISSLKWKP
jgi:hypothetical protein